MKAKEAFTKGFLFAARFPIWLRRVAMALLEIGADESLYFAPSRRRQRAFIRDLLSNRNAAKERRLIVSFSTMPDRIERLQPMLESLLNQTRPPDEIVLTIPKFSVRQKRGYRVPGYLAKVPRFRLLYADTDWGPATKFIPVIQEERAAGQNDTLIMVVDDDRVYPREAIEIYLHFHNQLPNAALCFRGVRMPHSLDWRDSWSTFGSKIQQPQRTAVITGGGSYLVQPRFFDESLWDYSSAPAGAFYVDDIWISGCLDRRGVEKYVVPGSRMIRSVLRQIGTMTLHDVPNGRRHSNNETIAFFGDTWNVFSPR